MLRRFVIAGAAVAALAGIAMPMAGAATANPSPTGSFDLSLPSTTGRGTADGSADMADLMTAVLKDADAYWTTVLERNGYDEPTVRYAWIPEGQAYQTACSQEPAGDDAAFYCPVDDTIYLSEAFAQSVREGALSRWPSGDAPSGALGDMAVAYVVAHEMGHNIQGEIGLFRYDLPTESIELHADCLAGAWTADAVSRRVADTGDFDRAEITAWLVGDYALDDPGHHGTPQERQQAFADGYDSLRSCNAYLQG